MDDGLSGESGTAKAETPAPRMESAIVSCSAAERPRQSPMYPNVSCPMIAPTRTAVEARFTAPLHFAPPQYWFCTMTCTMLMTTRLYAVDRFEAAAISALRVARDGMTTEFLLRLSWHSGFAEGCPPQREASTGVSQRR